MNAILPLILNLGLDPRISDYRLLLFICPLKNIIQVIRDTISINPQRQNRINSLKNEFKIPLPPLGIHSLKESPPREKSTKEYFPILNRAVSTPFCKVLFLDVYVTGWSFSQVSKRSTVHRISLLPLLRYLFSLLFFHSFLVYYFTTPFLELEIFIIFRYRLLTILV